MRCQLLERHLLDVAAVLPQVRQIFRHVVVQTHLAGLNLHGKRRRRKNLGDRRQLEDRIGVTALCWALSASPNGKEVGLAIVADHDDDARRLFLLDPGPTTAWTVSVIAAFAGIEGVATTAHANRAIPKASLVIAKPSQLMFYVSNNSRQIDQRGKSASIAPAMWAKHSAALRAVPGGGIVQDPTRPDFQHIQHSCR